MSLNLLANFFLPLFLPTDRPTLLWRTISMRNIKISLDGLINLNLVILWVCTRFGVLPSLPAAEVPSLPLDWEGPYQLAYFNSGGRSEGFFGFQNFGQKVFFFESMKDTKIYFGLRKKHSDLFGYCIFHQLKSTVTHAQFTAYAVYLQYNLMMQKQRDFLGYTKKVGIFWVDNSEVGIFLGIKYEHLSDHPLPLVITICDWGPLCSHRCR